MQQPLVDHGPYPEAAVAIPKQRVGLEMRSGRKGIRLGFPVPELCDSAVLGDQDSAVNALDQRVNALRRICHGIEPGWTRLPSPQARHRSRPEIASAILV